MTAPKIIFVHGMNANANSWNGVDTHEAITALWPDTEAVTLTGHDEAAFPPGSEPDTTSLLWCPKFAASLAETPATEATMADYIADVASAFPTHPPDGPAVRDVVLVGHSMGGMVISQVAAQEDHQRRICQLVYVAAMYPSRGDHVNGLRHRIIDDAGASFDLFGLCKDFKPHLPDCASALVKQPDGPLKTEFHPTDAFERIEKIYIGCSDDRIIPPPSQAAMLDRAETRPVTLDLNSTHLPQYIEQKALVDLLTSHMRRDVT